MTQQRTTITGLAPAVERLIPTVVESTGRGEYRSDIY